MTYSDAAFFIGKTHAVCEDYAFAPPLAKTTPRFQSVWLSDGCSSSPHTDVGARLLVHTMQKRMSDFQAVHEAETVQKQAALDELVYEAVKDAQQSAADIGVAKDSLDATLLGLVEAGGANDEDAVLYAFLYGDGALVLGLTDDTKIIYRSQYGAGYPFYPAYGGNAARLARWQNVEGNTHQITETTLNANGTVCTEREWTTPADAAPHYFLRRPVAGLRFAAVLSDGIESFQRRLGGETATGFETVPYLEIVKELTRFKQFKGEFVQRRMRAFEINLRRLDWHHNDDLSMAAMFFEE